MQSHKKDFLNCVSIIQKRLPRKLRDHPISFIDFMRKSLNEASNIKEFKKKLAGPNVRTRNAHDFYGWMSKDGAWGACRGAFYRSENYMKIALEKRSGKKSDIDEDFGVHIEHTIPVDVILESIWHCRKTFESISNDQILQKNYMRSSYLFPYAQRSQGRRKKPAYLKNTKANIPILQMAGF